MITYWEHHPASSRAMSYLMIVLAPCTQSRRLAARQKRSEQRPLQVSEQVLGFEAAVGESVQLNPTVKAEGNIEDWLNALLYPFD